MTSSLDPLAEGQATYGMANLEQERAGLPFIVFICQRDHSRHAARVKVSPAPEVRADAMGSYTLSPFKYEAGWRMAAAEETALTRWNALNQDVLRATGTVRSNIPRMPSIACGRFQAFGAGGLRCAREDVATGTFQPLASLRDLTRPSGSREKRAMDRENAAHRNPSP